MTPGWRACVRVCPMYNPAPLFRFQRHGSSLVLVCGSSIVLFVKQLKLDTRRPSEYLPRRRRRLRLRHGALRRRPWKGFGLQVIRGLRGSLPDGSSLVDVVMRGHGVGRARPLRFSWRCACAACWWAGQASTLLDALFPNQKNEHALGFLLG